MCILLFTVCFSLRAQYTQHASDLARAKRSDCSAGLGGALLVDTSLALRT